MLAKRLDDGIDGLFCLRLAHTGAGRDLVDELRCADRLSHTNLRAIAVAADLTTSRPACQAFSCQISPKSANFPIVTPSGSLLRALEPIRGRDPGLASRKEDLKRGHQCGR